MFTGIIEGTASVSSVSHGARRGSASRMTVELGRLARGLRAGQSVALNGVCLTVVRARARGSCDFEMIGETARRTSMRRVRRGDLLNVERSMRASGRIEGHFVLGHVDATGTIARADERGDETVIDIRLPAALVQDIAKKGSVAVDGASMTVTSLRGSIMRVSVIPHTLAVTNLGRRRRGDLVNIETDILAKYARQARARRVPKRR